MNDLAYIVGQIMSEVSNIFSSIREILARIEERQTVQHEKVNDLKKAVDDIDQKMNVVYAYVDKSNKVDLEKKKGNISLKNKIIILVLSSILGLILFWIKEGKMEFLIKLYHALRGVLL